MSFIEFLMKYYFYILVVLIILIVGVIGFLVDSKNKDKAKKDANSSGDGTSTDKDNLVNNVSDVAANNVAIEQAIGNVNNVANVNLENNPASMEVPSNNNLVNSNVSDNMQSNQGSANDILNNNVSEQSNILTPVNNINSVNDGGASYSQPIVQNDNVVQESNVNNNIPNNQNSISSMENSSNVMSNHVDLSVNQGDSNNIATNVSQVSNNTNLTQDSSLVNNQNSSNILFSKEPVGEVNSQVSQPVTTNMTFGQIPANDGVTPSNGSAPNANVVQGSQPLGQVASNITTSVYQQPSEPAMNSDANASVNNNESKPFDINSMFSNNQ